MLNIKYVVFLVLFFLLVSACSHHKVNKPSDGAAGMPGAKGVIEFPPADRMVGKTTWWKDSDGVSPGVAGCHIGTNEHGDPNGRMFGEGCLDNGLLVESNPGKGELHSHDNDLGHPDTFDCNAWCTGQGQDSGYCKAAPAPPCKSSAKCTCE